MGKKKVLITGAAGRIGRVLQAGLKNSMVEVTNGVDAVVHMTGNPSMEATFEEVLGANIRGTYCIYETARQTGVKRIVFASTNHVTGIYEQEGIYTTPGMPVRPDSYYGASKAYGEALERYYTAHGQKLRF